MTASSARPKRAKRTTQQRRTARYARGVAKIEEIVCAARNLLIQSGHAALSLRRLADECGLNVGNISYYFPAKHDLIKAVLSSIAEFHRTTRDEIAEDALNKPADVLVRLLMVWMKENEATRTSRLFVEIWSMSNSDAEVRDLVSDFYESGLQWLQIILQGVNPKLSTADARAIALFAASSMEGAMVFANRGKADGKYMGQIAASIVDATLRLAREGRGVLRGTISRRWRTMHVRAATDY